MRVKHLLASLAVTFFLALCLCAAVRVCYRTRCLSQIMSDDNDRDSLSVLPIHTSLEWLEPRDAQVLSLGYAQIAMASPMQLSASRIARTRSLILKTEDLALTLGSPQEAISNEDGLGKESLTSAPSDSIPVLKDRSTFLDIEAAALEVSPVPMFEAMCMSENTFAQYVTSLALKQACLANGTVRSVFICETRDIRAIVICRKSNSGHIRFASRNKLIQQEASYRIEGKLADSSSMPDSLANILRAYRFTVDSIGSHEDIEKLIELSGIPVATGGRKGHHASPFAK